MKITQSELEMSDNNWVRTMDGEMYLFHSIVDGENEVLYVDDSGRVILEDYEKMQFFCSVCHLWCPMHMISIDAFDVSSNLCCVVSYKNVISPHLRGLL